MISSIGKTRPEGLVTWSTTNNRVRGPSREAIAATTSSGLDKGNGTCATTVDAFERSAAYRTALLQAL